MNYINRLENVLNDMDEFISNTRNFSKSQKTEFDNIYIDLQSIVESMKNNMNKPLPGLFESID